MFKKFFIFSSIEIADKAKDDNIILWSDPKPLICKMNPHFAYFKLPISNKNNSVDFYANNTKILIDFSDIRSSHPFFHLQEILALQKEKNGTIIVTDQKISLGNFYSNIQQILNQNIFSWFDKKDLNENDAKFFFKIISLNFPFNNFTSHFLQHNHSIIQKLNQEISPENIEIHFKSFLLSIRPNGKPNPQPFFQLASSFLLFYQFLNQIQRPNFISHGIHYMLKYLLRDNQWGPYSIISYCSFLLGIEGISPFPMKSDVDFNTSIFFDERNLTNVEEIVSLYGISALIWSYHVSHHNYFCKIAKLSSTQTRKIKEVHLIELVTKKISSQSSPLLKFEDFDLFFAFIEKVSTSTNNQKIFISIENKSFHFQQFCDIKFNSQKQSSNLWFKDPDNFILNSFDYKTLKITLNNNNSIETENNPFLPRDLLFKFQSGQCNYQVDFTTIAQKSAKKVYSKDYQVHTKQLINENKQRRKSETNVFDLFAKESDDCCLFNNGEPKFPSRITIEMNS